MVGKGKSYWPVCTQAVLMHKDSDKLNQHE